MEQDCVPNDNHSMRNGHAELHVTEAYPLAHVFMGHSLPAPDNVGSNESTSSLYNDEVLVGPLQVSPGYPADTVSTTSTPAPVLKLTPASSSNTDAARMGNRNSLAAQGLCATDSLIENSTCEIYRDSKVLNSQKVLNNTHTLQMTSRTTSEDPSSTLAPRSTARALAATDDVMARSIFKVYRDGALVQDETEAPTNTLSGQQLEVSTPATAQNVLQVKGLPPIRTTTNTYPFTNTLATRAYESPHENPLRKYLDRVNAHTAIIMSDHQEPKAMAEVGVQDFVASDAMAGDGHILGELPKSSESLRPPGPDTSSVHHDIDLGGKPFSLSSTTLSWPAWLVSPPTAGDPRSDDIADKDLFPPDLSSPNDSTEGFFDNAKAPVFEHKQLTKRPTTPPATQHVTPASSSDTSPNNPSSASNKHPLPYSRVPAWPPMQLKSLDDLPASNADLHSTSPTTSSTSKDPANSLIFPRDILIFISGALLMGYSFQFIITPLTLAMLVIRPCILCIILERVEDMAESFREGYAVERPWIHRYDLPFLMLRNCTAILWWGLHCLGAWMQERAGAQIEGEDEEEQGRGVVDWVPHPLVLASSIMMAVVWMTTFPEKKITLLVLAVVIGLAWDNPKVVATALGRRAKMLSLIKEDAMLRDIAKESVATIEDDASEATRDDEEETSGEKMPTVKLQMHITNDSSPEETEAARRAEIQKDIEEADVSMARLLARAARPKRIDQESSTSRPINIAINF